jgi:hypothetical protein
MEYTFELVGVAPVLTLFSYQQEQQHKQGTAYLGAHRCTLDAFIQSIETGPFDRSWNRDRVVDTVIQFWLDNAEPICRWKQRLEEAGRENLLVGRLADLNALRSEFESLFGR